MTTKLKGWAGPSEYLSVVLPEGATELTGVELGQMHRSYILRAMTAAVRPYVFNLNQPDQTLGIHIEFPASVKKVDQNYVLGLLGHYISLIPDTSLVRKLITFSSPVAQVQTAAYRAALTGLVNLNNFMAATPSRAELYLNTLK